MTSRPHPDFALLSRRMGRCLGSAGAWSGTVYRCSSPRYATAEDLLSGVGSLRNGVRWTPPGSFATVYAGDSPETSLAEALNHHRYYGLPLSASMPRTFVAIEVSLGILLDLTIGPIRRRLGISLRRMVEEDWRREQSEGREALTQAIGRCAFETGYEGLFVPSAARQGAKNLIVFPDKLRASSRLVILRAEDLSPGR